MANAEPGVLQQISDSDTHGVVQLFGEFLKKNNKHINEAIAFLYIDLNEPKPRAGYICANQTDVVIIQLPWTESQVCEIGRVCDRYLSGPD